MEVYFNKLVSVLTVNDKKENVSFLLSSKIVNCSNSLSKNNFFIFNDKMKKIYIDKFIFTKIENELTTVINDYIKGDFHHLDKINKANHKYNYLFLKSINNESKQVMNINSLKNAKDFISSLISEADSKKFRNIIFNEKVNPIINLFFNKSILSKIKTRTIDKIVEYLDNKTVKLNQGCDLPYKLESDDIVLVKFGNIQIPNNEVIYECEQKNQNTKNNNKEIDSIRYEKDNRTAQYKFEILFDVLNHNIKRLHDEIDKYNKCVAFNNANNTFDFTKDSKKLFEDIYIKLDNKSIQDYAVCYHEFNKTSKALNLFYQDYIKRMTDGILKQDDYTNLLKMIKKIESNMESLKIELESLKPFSNACDLYKNEITNAASHLIMKGKNSAFSLITSIEVKTNEYKKILSDCIKRKETSILSRVYKWIFPKKYADEISSLNEHLDKVKKISSFISGYNINQNDVFSKNEIIAIVTAKLSETLNRDLLSYLYGENKKLDNFKRSLFN
ncbi:hypothetical protein I4902_11025 [Proteus alimentorum]|uniref:Uncharacterized protein n=1 Tax=Proteus alimentorum TaxID=1973495 RepID=A0ABS0IVF5_9GAMM|nr:hypothetical protein [Proteus alimentorum]MBG2879804.1 hypothetical protein [Proteus alimentorum]